MASTMSRSSSPAWAAGLPGNGADAARQRMLTLLPCLLLARVDGKSPVEYVTQDRDRNAIRTFARVHLKQRATSLTALAHAWAA